MAQSHRGFVEHGAEAGGTGGPGRLQQTLTQTTTEPPQQGETQSNKLVSGIPVADSQTAREPDQQRAYSSIPTTEVIVHYAVPAGSRYLHIYLKEKYHDTYRPAR